VEVAFFVGVADVENDGAALRHQLDLSADGMQAGLDTPVLRIGAIDFQRQKSEPGRMCRMGETAIVTIIIRADSSLVG